MSQEALKKARRTGVYTGARRRTQQPRPASSTSTRHVWACTRHRRAPPSHPPGTIPGEPQAARVGAPGAAWFTHEGGVHGCLAPRRAGRGRGDLAGAASTSRSSSENPRPQANHEKAPGRPKYRGTHRTPERLLHVRNVENKSKKLPGSRGVGEAGQDAGPGPGTAEAHLRETWQDPDCGSAHGVGSPRLSQLGRRCRPLTRGEARGRQRPPCHLAVNLNLPKLITSCLKGTPGNAGGLSYPAPHPCPLATTS